MGRSVGRGLDPYVGVYGRHGACPPPRGRGRACPARGFPGDGRRKKVSGASGTPPPTWVDARGWVAARTCGRGGHSLMGRSVGRGLDPSVDVYGRHEACPPPRGRGRACPARGVSRGWAVMGCFRGVGDAAPYVGGCVNLRRGVGTPPYGCRGGLYAAREFMWDAVLRLLFFFQHWAGHTVENVSSLPGMDV